MELTEEYIELKRKAWDVSIFADCTDGSADFASCMYNEALEEMKQKVAGKKVILKLTCGVTISVEKADPEQFEANFLDRDRVDNTGDIESFIVED